MRISQVGMSIVLCLVAGVVFFYGTHQDDALLPKPKHLLFSGAPLPVDQNAYVSFEKLWNTDETIRKVRLEYFDAPSLFSYVQGKHDRSAQMQTLHKKLESYLKELWRYTELPYQEPEVFQLLEHRKKYSGLGEMEVEDFTLLPDFVQENLLLLLLDVKLTIQFGTEEEVLWKMQRLTNLFASILESPQSLAEKRVVLEMVKYYLQMLYSYEVVLPEERLPEKEFLKELRRKLIPEKKMLYEETLRVEFVTREALIMSTFHETFCSFHCSYTFQKNKTLMELQSWFAFALTHTEHLCTGEDHVWMSDFASRQEENEEVRDRYKKENLSRFLEENSEGKMLLAELLPDFGSWREELCTLP